MLSSFMFINFFYAFLLLYASSDDHLVFGDLFTAVAEMENLVILEKNLATSLQAYIEAEKVRLNDLSSLLTTVNDIHESIDENEPSKFLGNPINSYLLLKRFSSDWANLGDYLEKDYSEDIVAYLDSTKAYFPNVEDYEGAMTAILRLQDTYHLSASRLANGSIPGTNDNNKLPIKDIFALGKHAYTIKDWYNTKGWMDVALNRLKDESVINNVKKFDVLDHLAIAEYWRGDLHRAALITDEMVRLKPSDQRVIGNREYYREELRKSENTGQLGDTGTIDNTEQYFKKTVKRSPSKSDEWTGRTHRDSYEKLCRGETRKLSRRESAQLFCWYESKNPVLILKPMGIERVWVKPEILFFRKFMSDAEIKTIKELAKPKLMRATIQDPVTGQLRHADYRISKSAWLKDNTDKVVNGISRRIEQITGLTCETAEELQIANYGIGGHYEPHFDFAREEEDAFTELGVGNRIATVLTYMSDVPAGGATVFTSAKAAVYPSKGDAVFWYNLKRNGKGDLSTRHAACPVLAGIKWVSNKWLHVAGQEFRRKCALDEHL